MNLISKAVRWTKRIAGIDASSKDPRPGNSVSCATSPNAAIDVLAYLDKLDNGSEPDAAFEATILYPDFGFTSLSLAEVLRARAVLLGVPVERVSHFMAVGITEGGDENISNLILRVDSLAKSGMNDEERTLMLNLGVLGDPAEIAPIQAPFNTVGMVVKLTRVIKSLGMQQGHDAIDVTSCTIPADPEWRQ